MTFQGINNMGFGLIQHPKVIGEGDPAQPTDNVEALVENSEWIDTAIKPLIFRHGPASPPTVGGALTTYLHKTWVVYIPRTLAANGRIAMRVRARLLSGVPVASGLVTATFKAADLVNILGNIQATITTSSYQTYTTTASQPVAPNTWAAVTLTFTDTEIEWIEVYCDTDTAIP